MDKTLRSGRFCIVTSQYSTVVLTVVRVMIAKYRKQGNLGYCSSLTAEPIELKLYMSDYVAHRTRPHMHHGVIKCLGGEHRTGVKCNPHVVDIPMFFWVISLPRVQTRVFTVSP